MRSFTCLALIALLLLTFVLSFIDAGALRAAVALPVLLIAPGAAVVRLLYRRSLAPTLALALALALAPFVLGVVMTALLFAGVDAAYAARLVVLLTAGGLVYDLYRRRQAKEKADDTGRPRGIGVLALCAAVVLTSLMAYPVAKSNRVRASIHGMLHAAVLYSVVDRGVPPENPFYAGKQIRYYWTWHAAMAAVSHAANVEPTVAFASSTMAALLAFLLLLGHLGRQLFRSRSAALLAVLLGLLSLNPLGLIFFANREAAAQGREVATLEQIATGLDPINYIHDLTIGGDDRISATFTKFMNVSSFPTSFALLIAVWLLLARVAVAPRMGTSLLAALATAGCIALSPITGLTAGLALGAAALPLLLLALRAGADGRNALLAVIGSLVAGLLLAVPFVLLGGAGSGDTIGLVTDPGQMKTVVSRILWNLGPALLIGLPAALMVLRRGDRGARLLVYSLPVLLVLAFVISFPVASEYKMVRMAAPLIGVFAAGSVAWFAERLWRPAGIALCAVLVILFVPTNAVAWNCYLAHSRATLPFHGEGTLVVVDQSKHPVAAMYRYILEKTPRDAVILHYPLARAHHFAGRYHGDEVPVLAHRPVFTDMPSYMNDYEPNLERRIGLVNRVFSGVPLPDTDHQMLLSLRRPVFLLARTYDPGIQNIVLTVGADPRWRQVTSTGNACLFRLQQ